MDMDIMIDIETLGRRNDAAITEIGAVSFNPESGRILDELHLRISPTYWGSYGRIFTGETLIWWLTINKDNIENLNKGRHNYSEAIDKLTSFIKNNSYENTKVYAKGPMDLSVIKDLCEKLQKPIPWEFWQPRDMRTLTDIPGWKKTSKSTNTHNALDDAKNQVREFRDNAELFLVKSCNYTSRS